MTKDEVQHKRKVLKSSADKLTVYKSGNEKVYHSHLCAVCGRKLTTYTPASKTPYKYTTDSIRCSYSGINFYLCEHLRSCYRQLNLER